MIPEPLQLMDIEQAPGTIVSIQWQQSIEGSPFEDLVGETNTTLTFDSTSDWFTNKNAAYRTVIIANSDVVCEVITTPVTIAIDQQHLLNQTEGPEDSQVICPGSEMIPITFQYGGGANGIEIPDGLIAAPGIEIVVDDLANEITISGRTSSSLFMEFTTYGNDCTPATRSYELMVNPIPDLPGPIFVDGNHVMDGGSNFQFNTHSICEGTPTTQLAARFQDPESSTYTNLEWELVDPLDAGTVDRNSGQITWRTGGQDFYGTATFRVRGRTDCGQVTPWTEFEIIVEEQVFPPPELEGVEGPILATRLASCQTNDQTPETQFFIPAPNGGTTFGTIIWSIEPLTGGNPGRIDPNTGIMTWAPGFWGTFNVHVDPTDCHGELDRNR